MNGKLFWKFLFDFWINHWKGFFFFNVGIFFLIQFVTCVFWEGSRPKSVVLILPQWYSTYPSQSCYCSVPWGPLLTSHGHGCISGLFSCPQSQKVILLWQTFLNSSLCFWILRLSFTVRSEACCPVKRDGMLLSFCLHFYFHRCQSFGISHRWIQIFLPWLLHK